MSARFLMKYDKKRKMGEKTGFYEMGEGERETELKCGRITRNVGDFGRPEEVHF